MPYGDRDRPQSPFGSEMPDFRQLWRVYGRVVLALAVVLLFAVTGFLSYFTVKLNEEAVVLRFGEFNTRVGPGLHFKFPFGIDRVLKEEVMTVHKTEFGFQTETTGVSTRYRYSGAGAKEVSLMLTADLNSSDIRWVVRYKIKKLEDYLFNVANVEVAIRDISEAVMRRIVGDSSIDEVLMTRPEEMEVDARAQMQTLLDYYGCGVDIRSVKFKQTDPPQEVRSAFDEVNEARQTRDQIINEAEADKNRELIPAEGRKKRAIETANGYKEKRVNEAQGDAEAFLAVLEKYKAAKEITRRRLYLETMAKVLPNCGKLFLFDESQKGIVPFLRLDELLPGQRRGKGIEATGPSRDASSGSARRRNRRVPSGGGER